MTVSDAGKLGVDDEEHLRFARTEGRVLFTQDADFLSLHASGIVYARQTTPLGEMIYGLMLVSEVLDSVEMEGQIEFL